MRQRIYPSTSMRAFFKGSHCHLIEIFSENSIIYMTPDMSCFSADVAIIVIEDENEDDEYLVAVKFKHDNIYPALAYGLNIEGEKTSHLPLVTKFSIEDLTLGLMRSKFEDDATDFDEDGFMVTAACCIGYKSN